MYELNKKQGSTADVIRLKQQTDDMTLSIVHMLLTTTPCDMYTMTTNAEELNIYADVIEYYMLSEWDPVIRMTCASMDEYERAYYRV